MWFAAVSGREMIVLLSATGFCSSLRSVNRQFLMPEMESAEPGLA